MHFFNIERSLDATVNEGSLITKETLMKKHLVGTHSVLCQKWEESERGWGTRPNGYSLHRSDADRVRFIEEYWAQMPDEAPNEYSRPDGTPYWCIVSKETYAKIISNKYSDYGLRFSGPYPGNGGIDGWVPLRGGGHGRV